MFIPSSILKTLTPVKESVSYPMRSENNLKVSFLAVKSEDVDAVVVITRFSADNYDYGVISSMWDRCLFLPHEVNTVFNTLYNFYDAITQITMEASEALDIEIDFSNSDNILDYINPELLVASKKIIDEMKGQYE